MLFFLEIKYHFDAAFIKVSSLCFSKSISNTGNVKFYDEIESLKKETKKLRENGVNIIIGLGHSGIKVDEVIAREVEDLDLIVGGHSHTLLWTGKQISHDHLKTFIMLRKLFKMYI